MCFSAPASFIASGALGAAGVATLRKTKTPAEIPLASVPVIFAVQQLAEGLVWLSLGTGSSNTCATNIYVFFAYAFWPMFIPVASLLVEKDAMRKKFLYFLTAVGWIVGLEALSGMFSQAILVQASNAHIVYGSFPTNYSALSVGYVLSTCGSLIVSSHKWLRVLGAATFVALVISVAWYFAALPSVWCFLSAILSFIIYKHFE